MKICVIGWHFHSHFFKVLSSVQNRYLVSVICHRQGNTEGLPKTLIPNIGLEFGSYNFYLMNMWNEESDVLFIHDDIRLLDTTFFSRIEKTTTDQVFIFSNEAERLYNSNAHGRAFFCSYRFLHRLKKDGGFQYDSGNKGFVADGHYTDTKPPEGCGHHNKAIHAFVRYLEKIKNETDMIVGVPIISNDIVCARRGKYK